MTLYQEARQLSYIEGGDLSALLADGALVEVKPTDLLCTYHRSITSVGNERCSLSYADLGNDFSNGLPVCDLFPVVRMPKEGTGYPQGSVTRAAELQAEDADPELHHHEVSHSHPFENLDHTHDQPKLDDNEKEDDE